MEKESKGLNIAGRVKERGQIAKKSEAKREVVTVSPPSIPSCPNCNSKQLVKYGNYIRKTKLLSIDKQVYDVIITAKRYKCKHCDFVFRQDIESLKRFKRTCGGCEKFCVKYSFDNIFTTKPSKKYKRN